MEETKMSEVVSEIKGASEEELRKVIEKWFESTRTQGMKIGAQFISAAVYGAIEKNLKKGSNSSLRDYQRAIKRIMEIVSVQLKQQETQQNDSKETTEEDVNDGTAE
jgi:hypothetical protein